MTHPEDTQAAHIEPVRGGDLGRLDDALSASDRGLDVELLHPDEHDGVVLVGPELALGHCYVILDQHADEWADEGEGPEVRACKRLRDDLYDGLLNARGAVGLARITLKRRRGGDRTAADETYGTVDETYELSDREDQ